MGSRFHTSFWEDPWLGSVPLNVKFHGSLSNSLYPEGVVDEIREVVDGILTWDLKWRRSFFLRELSIFDVFHSFLSDGNFSIASAYLVQRESFTSSIAHTFDSESNPSLHLK